MKKIKIISILAAFLVVVVLSSGCVKSFNNKLKGKWKMEKMTLFTKSADIVWEFESDGKFTVANDWNSGENDTLEGKYTRYGALGLSNILDIETPLGLAGRWRVEKLTRKVLVMTRVSFSNKKDIGGAYLRRKFTRQ